MAGKGPDYSRRGGAGGKRAVNSAANGPSEFNSVT